MLHLKYSVTSKLPCETSWKQRGLPNKRANFVNLKYILLIKNCKINDDYGHIIHTAQ